MVGSPHAVRARGRRSERSLPVGCPAGDGPDATGRLPRRRLVGGQLACRGVVVRQNEGGNRKLPFASLADAVAGTRRGVRWISAARDA